MRIIFTIMNFYWSHPIALQNCPMNVLSYKFSWILTLTEVISNRILRMRIISAIMNFYWSHAIPLPNLSNERSYKFSWILTLTEVISIRNLKFFARLKKWHPINSANAAEPKQIISNNYSLRWQTDDRRQMKLRSNTHGCELTSWILLFLFYSSVLQTFV